MHPDATDRTLAPQHPDGDAPALRFEPPAPLPPAAPGPTRRGICALLPAAVLAGCAGVPEGDGYEGDDGQGPRPGPGAPKPPPRRTLASEQRRLAKALEGTPVGVARTADGLLQLTVPLDFCFEPRRSAVRPPLAAVLDRVVPGVREPQGLRLRVRAPSDAEGAGGERLALDRAASVRDYLAAKGVPPVRVLQLSRSDAAQVELLLSERST